jgi:hypothetical protein
MGHFCTRSDGTVSELQADIQIQWLLQEASLDDRSCDTGSCDSDATRRNV